MASLEVSNAVLHDLNFEVHRILSDTKRWLFHLQFFDNEIKELVNSSKLSSSKIKTVTDAAMANIAVSVILSCTNGPMHYGESGGQQKADCDVCTILFLPCVMVDADDNRAMVTS